MIFVWATAYLLLMLLQMALLVRIVFDVVQSFARDWAPHGILLLIASAVYSMTDAPLRWLRSKIPPLNLGGVGIDVAFLILFVVVMLAKSITLVLAQSSL